MDYTIDVLHGDEIESYLGSVARLRIEVFREFPYLYDGDLDYERDYLTQYATSQNCIFVVARDNDGQVVGASTGVRMDDADVEFQRPFVGQDLTEIFYFGESVLDPHWRGRGIGHVFFDEREKFAAGIGCTTCTFCVVERDSNHPNRPADYQPLDGFWHKRGYIRLDHLRTTYAWKDLGDEHETAKEMVYWVRRLGT
jgi:GNAT superfamily N-acetyltransferase